MPRRHVSGWELLGHETDPTPGDPDAVRRVATAYSGIAEQAERAHQLLRGERIRDGAGDAMRELNARVDELPDQLRRTYESFRRVGDAYRGYAETLVSSQDLLDQAIDRAQAVHRTATLELPDTPPSEAPPSEVQEHDRQATRINAARTELGAAERLAAEARSLREDGGADGPGSRQVARELDEAAALAIEERDLWDRAVDLFDDAGEAIDQFFKDHPWLETVLQIAVGILTIAFPVLGLILGAVLLLVQAWRMAATGNWDITALAIGVLSLASGGIIRALALAGRLGPVATILRAMSTRTGSMRNAVTSATAGLRSAGRTIGARIQAMARPVLRGRTDRVLGAGREGLAEGATEAVVETGIQVATGRDVSLRDVLTNAAVGTATGAGGRGLADRIHGLGGGPAGPGAASGGGDGAAPSGTAGASGPTPDSATSAATTGGSPAAEGTRPTAEQAAVGADRSETTVTGGGGGSDGPRTPAAAGPSDSTPAGGAARTPDEGAPLASGARPDPEPATVADADRNGPDPTPDTGEPRRDQEIVADERLIYADHDPLVDDRAPGVQTPFRQQPDLATNTDYVVVDRQGQYRGVFHTDDTGRITEVTTTSSAVEAFQLDRTGADAATPTTDSPIAGSPTAGSPTPESTTSESPTGPDAAPSAARRLRDGLNPDLTNRPPRPDADGTLPTDPARYTNLLPETTYHVDGRYEITTDSQARVRTMEIHDIDLDSAAPPRSAAQQRNAADLGRMEFPGQARWNGGHDDANQFGGFAEGANQHAMLEELNQRRAAHPDNWYAFEQEMHGYAEAGHDVRRVMTFDYSGSSRVPHRIDVEFTIGDEAPQHRSFDNVPPSPGGSAGPQGPDPGGPSDLDRPDGRDPADPYPSSTDGPPAAEIDAVLGEHGLTREEFHDLASTPADSLTPEQARVVHDVRHAVPLTPDTVVSKVLPAETVRLYLDNAAVRPDGGAFKPAQVGGFVARHVDVAGINSPAELYDGLALGYEHTPFSPTDERIYSMRFAAEDTGQYSIPFGGHSREDGSTMTDFGPPPDGVAERPTFQDHPFTGTGFTGSADHVVPELTRNPAAQVPEGAAIYEIDASGNERVVGIYGGPDVGWTPVNGGIS